MSHTREFPRFPRNTVSNLCDIMRFINSGVKISLVRKLSQLSQPCAVQFVERGMFHKAAPPGSNLEVDMPAMLPVLSATPGSTRWAGPELGFHTDTILQEVGCTRAEGEGEAAGMHAGGGHTIPYHTMQGAHIPAF